MLPPNTNHNDHHNHHNDHHNHHNPLWMMDAARAVVSSTTDATTRAAASAALEAWVSLDTATAWEQAPSWLAAAAVAATVVREDDATASLWLCVQLLHAKIRRYVTMSTTTMTLAHSSDPSLAWKQPLLSALETELGTLVLGVSNHNHTSSTDMLTLGRT